MSKVRFYDVDKKERNIIIGELYEIIAELKNKDEVFKFLFELFTPSEVLMIARRVQIAKMLSDGAICFDICKQLKVSHQTVEKVERWLKSDEDRANLINLKLNKIKNKKTADERIYRSQLDKYPGHKLLKNLITG